MSNCYECGAHTKELSPRSRCVSCEHRRAIYNEEENYDLRMKIEENFVEWQRKYEAAEELIAKLEQEIKQQQEALESDDE